MWLQDGICVVPGGFPYSWVLVAPKVRRALEVMEGLRIIRLTSSWKKDGEVGVTLSHAL